MAFTPLAEPYVPQFEGQGILDLIIVLLVTAIFVYVAARIVAGRASYLAAIGTVLVGNLVLALVLYLLSGANPILALVLAVLAWGLVAAIFFRTRWLQGAVIGVVAALLWLLVKWALSAMRSGA